MFFMQNIGYIALRWIMRVYLFNFIFIQDYNRTFKDLSIIYMINYLYN